MNHPLPRSKPSAYQTQVFSGPILWLPLATTKEAIAIGNLPPCKLVVENWEIGTAGYVCIEVSGT